MTQITPESKLINILLSEIRNLRAVLGLKERDIFYYYGKAGGTAFNLDTRYATLCRIASKKEIVQNISPELAIEFLRFLRTEYEEMILNKFDIKVPLEEKHEQAN